MHRTFLHSKLHRATVTDAHLDYEGSLSLDIELMNAAGFSSYEKVLVVNINNGQRFETYLIEAPAGSRMVCLNGAAARLGLKGDKVILMTFAELSEEEISKFKPIVVKVDENNRIMV